MSFPLPGAPDALVRRFWSVDVSGNWRLTFRFEGEDASGLSGLSLKERGSNMRMHNPPHPGSVLRDYLGSTPVTNAARHLGITRVTLSA
jgi:hypothetical protein